MLSARCDEISSLDWCLTGPPKRVPPLAQPSVLTNGASFQNWGPSQGVFFIKEAHLISGSPILDVPNCTADPILLGLEMEENTPPALLAEGAGDLAQHELRRRARHVGFMPWVAQKRLAR